MKSKRMIMILIALIGLSLPYALPAQWQFSLHADAGAHNASEGMYLRSAAGAQYRLQHTVFNADVQFELYSNVPRHFSGRIWEFHKRWRFGNSLLNSEPFFCIDHIPICNTKTTGDYWRRPITGIFTFCWEMASGPSGLLGRPSRNTRKLPER